MSIIGRKLEQKQLLSKLDTNKSELVAILGRRRVGKTFLVRSTFQENLFFQFTGLYKGNLGDQLIRFNKTLQGAGGKKQATPSSWFEAFDGLKNLIQKVRSKKKKVIFLDEFPWMATNKSKFLTAFTDFWNSFASTRSDLVIIICGSSASWMINKVLKNKGGLHNRVTDRIFLEPFTLHETERFLVKKNIRAGMFDIVKLYMAFGGIPFYLDLIEKGESLPQAIDRLCFKKNAPLQLEYNELLSSLFDNASSHKTIIELLSKHPQGLVREVLLKKSKLNSGGGFTTVIEELEYSGFINSILPIDKTKNEKIYKLRDFYTLFYLHQISQKPLKKGNTWLNLFNTPSVNTWSGYAFENLCHNHIEQIKKALKIDGIVSEYGAWRNKPSDGIKGTQIDLVINRADGIVNVCEIKFMREAFLITSDYAHKLRLKLSIFKQLSGTKKSVLLTMITANGVVKSKHSMDLVQNEITLEDLFKE